MARSPESHLDECNSDHNSGCIARLYHRCQQVLRSWHRPGLPEAFDLRVVTRSGHQQHQQQSFGGRQSTAITATASAVATTAARTATVAVVAAQVEAFLSRASAARSLPGSHCTKALTQWSAAETSLPLKSDGPSGVDSTKFALSEKGVRLARRMQIDLCILVGTQP